MDWKNQTNPKTPFEIISYSTFCSQWFMKGIASNKAVIGKGLQSFIGDVDLSGLRQTNQGPQQVRGETTEHILLNPLVTHIVCHVCSKEVDAKEVEHVFRYDQSPYDPIYLHCCNSCYKD
jgi:hypothetical protein